MRALPSAVLALALSSLALAATPAAAEPARYTLDPAHSWVQFELSHFGTSTIRGRLGPAEGSVSLDRGTVRVERAWKWGGAGTGWVIGPPKSPKSRRTVNAAVVALKAAWDLAGKRGVQSHPDVIAAKDAKKAALA